MPTRLPEPPRSKVLELCRIYLCAIGVLVPPEARRNWREEWATELACRRECRRREGRWGPRTAAVLLLEAAGALADAFWHLREEWSLDMLMQDLRYGLRALVRKPGFTAVAVLTLALGIGAVTAIYSIVDAVLLDPLPYPEPGRLMVLWEKNPQKGWYKQTASGANFMDWREQSASFSDVAATFFGPWSFSLSGGGEPRPVTVQMTTGNLFDVLGVPPLYGRPFDWDATWDGADSGVVISHGLWQRHFGSDPSAVGRTIRLNQESYTVAAVMPPGFSYPQAGIDVWSTFGWDPAVREQVWFRRAHFLRVVGRLAPGVSSAAAEAEVESIMTRLEKAYPETNTQAGAGLTPLHEWTVGDTRRPLLLLLGAVALVLLIACANVVNLLLVRAGARSREMAVRSALGAGHRRLVRQLVTENLMLALGAGLAGAAFGRWGLQMLLAWSPEDIPRLDEITLDARVFLTALGVTVLATGVFGLFPALSGSRFDVRSSLHEGSRSASASRRQRRIRSVLVIGEVAVALLLVAGAGLVVKSFYNLYQVNPGFDPERLLAVKISPPGATYEDDPAVDTFFDELTGRVEALPAVESAATVSEAPFLGTAWTGSLSVEGRPPEAFYVEVQHIDHSPGLFRTMEIPLRAGRDFTDADHATAPPVIVINETLARQSFPGEDPVGQRVAFTEAPGESSTWYTVVGVVADIRIDSLRGEVRPLIYQPVRQEASRTRELMVRTAGDPRALVPLISGLVKQMDAELPLMRATAMTDALASTVARERFVMLLLAAFGSVALLLAAIGTYGVMAVAVHQRTREIGIRMALGASARDVVRQVVREGMGLVAVGFVVGLAATFSLAHFLGSLLFEVTPSDPTTHVAVSLVLLAAGLLASFLPARRASRIDPMTTLRSE